MTPAHSLRAVIEEAIDTSEVRFSLKDLTVLSPQVDPFRQDTEANHRDAEWLAEHAQSLGLLSGEKTIHLRGMHYALLGSVKPDGSQYVNDDDAWTWVNKAAKSARWLGYIPFDKIHDQKHPDPIIREFSRVNPWPYLSVGIDVDIPEVDDIDPKVGMLDFHGVQPYRLVIIGEKSSLEGVLNPVAARFGADLYLLTGNISDTLVHRIAQSGADDGRQVNVFYFSDCDPYGWNMPIEVGRKLQAFKASLYPDLEFRQYRIALTPEQVHEYHLPSTPLKSNERTARRNANWLKAFGVEQTEIDALATLQPSMPKLTVTNSSVYE
jgi:hypothetical protein